MNKKVIASLLVSATASLLVAATAALSAPAFASSGYGPAPSYNPLVGAPASQRGPSAMTVAADQAAGENTRGYGGVTSARSGAGSRTAAVDAQSVLVHH